MPMTKTKNHSDRPVFIDVSKSSIPDPVHKGYDPEMLYVECGRCGAPVLWEHGRSTEILSSAGIDPLELDPSCILVTDGCPQCTDRKHYPVQIYRLSLTPSGLRPLTIGNA